MQLTSYNILQNKQFFRYKIENVKKNNKKRCYIKNYQKRLNKIKNLKTKKTKATRPKIKIFLELRLLENTKQNQKKIIIVKNKTFLKCFLKNLIRIFFRITPILLKFKKTYF